MASGSTGSGMMRTSPNPAAVLAQAARTVKPGGRFVLCDMLPHEHEEYKQQMGHVWLGF